MLQFLADENFNGRIVRGLELAVPSVDLVRAQDEELSGVTDADVLKWAAENGRIVLTHDIRTLVADALARVAAGEAMPGVIAVRDTLPIGNVIADLALIAELGQPDDFDNQVTFLPI